MSINAALTALRAINDELAASEDPDYAGRALSAYERLREDVATDPAVADYFKANLIACPADLGDLPDERVAALLTLLDLAVSDEDWGDGLAWPLRYVYPDEDTLEDDEAAQERDLYIATLHSPQPGEWWLQDDTDVQVTHTIGELAAAALALRAATG